MASTLLVGSISVSDVGVAGGYPQNSADQATWADDPHPYLDPLIGSAVDTNTEVISRDTSWAVTCAGTSCCSTVSPKSKASRSRLFSISTSCKLRHFGAEQRNFLLQLGIVLLGIDEENIVLENRAHSVPEIEEILL